MAFVQRFGCRTERRGSRRNGARTGLKDAKGKAVADYLEAAAAARPQPSQEGADYQRVKPLLANAKR
jgi:hypothetical protein